MFKIKILLKTIRLFIFFTSLSILAADVTVPVGGNIQKAIDDVNKSGGGTVTLASGTHIITETLEMKSNVTFQGSGTYASIVKINENKQIMAEDGYSNNKTNAVNNVLIQNITFIGINGDEGGVAITKFGTDNENITFSNVRCYNVGWGVHIKGAKNVLIENCDFSENGAKGKEGFAHNLYLRRVYGAVIKNSIFNNSISANGINISYSEDIEVRNCEMIGNYFRGVRAADSDGYLVHDCIITDNGNVGLLANTEVVVTKNIDWANNCVANNGTGIETKNGATGTIKNCNSYGNGSNYKLVSSVSQSNNISDSSKECKSSGPIDPNPPVQDGTLVHITKRNATGFAIDGGNGGANGQNVTLSAANTSDQGQLWVEIDRGNGFYSYEKYGTNFSLDGNNGGATRQSIYIWQTSATNQNQQWQKQAVGDGGFKLIKRNATGFAINGGSGGVEGRDVNMWSSASTNQNLQWFITPIAENVRIEAEDFDNMSGIQTEASTESGDNVGYINNGDWLRFDDVNLSGITNMDARVATKFAGGTIEVRTGSITGTLIGSIDVNTTGGHQNWRTLNSVISNTGGTQDVYLVFTGGSGYLFNVNWIEFNTDSESNKESTFTTISDIVMYPNPVTTTTTIRNAANSIITIYDMNGKEVWSKYVSDNNETMDLSFLSSGIYYAKVNGSQSFSTIKIAKQ
ncbi:carbohydrate-binding protein [uncultured Aquimarina sp.]|uniref:carbohydrate-binding protein n=1 Tax=uncultured Aquimarina sp. TaxID=575652 RepID=UPI00260A843A|nr:carbohydrate-binding protein [uncultured Aquimarina sp.]